MKTPVQTATSVHHFGSRPVVVAAVVLPERFDAEGVNDSKQLTALQRDSAYDRIIKAGTCHIEVVDPTDIDRHNILRATLLAMSRCLAALDPKPHAARIDGNALLPEPCCPCETWVKGDGRDAAIAAATLARSHMSARPISLVRYLGGLGQSTDPGAPSDAEGGLPLLPGSIERVDDASSAPGERHAHLRHHVGELALRVWPGEPGVGARRAVGVRWVLAKDWVPYQSRFSVSPPSPGYVALPSTLARSRNSAPSV